MGQKENNSILGLLEAVAATARNGLHFTDSEYDRERYKRLLELSASYYAGYSDLSQQEILEGFKKELGCITPKVGVNGIVINEKQEVLLEKRTDDHCWGLPGGWAEVGEGPEGSLRREFLEETGLEIEPLGIIRIFTRLPDDSFPFTAYHILYKCRVKGGTIKVSAESFEVAFKPVSEIKDWHRDHREWIAFALGE